MAAFSSLLGTFSLAVVIPFLLMGEHLFQSHQLNLLHLRKASVRRKRFRRNTCIFDINSVFISHGWKMYHCICGLTKSKVHATTCFSHKENNI
jgi:hypothetical protein